MTEFYRNHDINDSKRSWRGIFRSKNIENSFKAIHRNLGIPIICVFKMTHCVLLYHAYGILLFFYDLLHFPAFRLFYSIEDEINIYSRTVEN